MTCRLVAIGGSAGAMDAVYRLLERLPADFAAPVVVVQHRSRESAQLAEVLQDATRLLVRDAADMEPLEPGRVYLAPADYHLLVGAGRISLTTAEPVLYSRPSIDVTLESASDAYGADVVAAVLTGANRDGAAGLRRIVDRGGRALVQDPATAEAATMPAAALAAVPEARVLSLDGIAEFLAALVRGSIVDVAE